jgi:tetratricopeptide (TPR) repeat protein
MNRGRLLTYMGRTAEADEAFDRALRLARDHGELEILCWAHQGCVDLAWLRGDEAAAGAHGAQAVEVAERIGTLLASWSAYHALGRALTLRGETSEAIAALERALATMRDNRTGLHLQPLVLASLAEAYLEAGRPRDALAVAAEAQETGDGAIAVRARTLLARARRETGDADLRSEGADLVGCLHVLQDTGYRSLEPALREELAALAKALGDIDEYTFQCAEVKRLYEEMGAVARLDRLPVDLA